MLYAGKWIAVVIAVCMIVLGCSGGSNISAPDEIQEPTADADNSSHYCWGLWQGVIDPDAQTIEFVKMREGNMHLNAMRFLEPPALVYLTIENVEFNGNLLTADIGLRHPFLGLAQFTGFDVCGIFIGNGSVSGFTDTDIVMSGDGDTRLLNPDGLSRWWNPSEFPMDGTMLAYQDGVLGTPDSIADFNSTINGYKYFCDDLDDIADTLEEVTIEGRGVFSTGQQNIRRYEIELGTEGLVFNYAIDASWVPPLGSPPWDVPDDFPAEANRPEAWRADVTETLNTLYYDNVTSTGGGSLYLSIDVYDWFNADLNVVRVESPGVFDAVTASAPSGGGECYSTYIIEITDASPAQTGDLPLLITVECEETDFDGFISGIPTSAYFQYTTQVGAGGDNLPPVADASNVGPICGLVPIEVSLDPTGSYDPDGTIVLYEWDFDGDMTYDYSNSDGSVIPHTYSTVGDYDITLKVTDDGGLWDTDTIVGEYDSDSGPMSYTVLTDMPTARERPFVAHEDGLIYVIGGCTGPAYHNPTGAVEVYDPETDLWNTNFPSMPHPTSAGATGVIDGVIYCATGGPGIHNQLQGFDTNTDSWLTSLTGSPTSRVNTTGTVLDGKFYVMGGFNSGAKIAVEVYDPGTDSWTFLDGNMPDVRGTGAWALLGDKIYYFGGIPSSYTFSTEVHSYDIEDELWEAHTPLTSPWVYQRAAEYCGRAYIFGGLRSGWDDISNDAEMASF